MALATVIAAAQGIARFVPGVIRFFKGDDAANVAQQVVDAGMKLTGAKDPAEAERKLAADPALQIQLQQIMQPIIIAQLEAETAQLQLVNATMQAEYASDDKFVKRWRPFFGYIIAITWFCQMLALCAVIIMHPGKAPAVITAMAGLSFMWGIALSVLGVSVHKRSQDKQVAAGQTPVGAIASLKSLAARLRGNKE